MPRRVRLSASTRNSLCRRMVSSRSFGPDPATSTAPGNGPAPADAGGRVSVPASETSGAPPGNTTSEAA